MARENGGYTPKEVSKLEKSREKSDVELMKGGAELNEHGELIATENQKNKAYEEMKREIEQKTIEEHTTWVQRHPEEIGVALNILGIGSFTALVGAAQAEMLPDAINNLPPEVAYAVVTLQVVAAIGGTALMTMGRGLSEKWKARALAKGEKEQSEKDLKEKLRLARKQQGS